MIKLAPENEQEGEKAAQRGGLSGLDRAFINFEFSLTVEQFFLVDEPVKLGITHLLNLAPNKSKLPQRHIRPLLLKTLPILLLYFLRYPLF